MNKNAQTKTIVMLVFFLIILLIALFIIDTTVTKLTTMINSLSSTAMLLNNNIEFDSISQEKVDEENGMYGLIDCIGKNVEGYEDKEVMETIKIVDYCNQ